MAESKNTFLDRTGLSHLLSKLGEAFAKKTHTHNVATQTTSGMQSAEDKKKLDGIEDGANKTTTAEDIGLATETWTFTLEDGSTVTKAVYVG